MQLCALSVADMAEGARVLQSAGDQSATFADCAQRIAANLYDLLRDGTEPACALVRVFKTHRLGQLEPALAGTARAASPVELHDDTRCLLLMGTFGTVEVWQARETSKHHRVIPLPSRAVVERSPMLARLFSDLGIDIRDLVAADDSALIRLEGRTCSVFFVQEALGSPYVPDQAFVTDHGVRSVVGCGAALPSGEVFAIIIFSRVALTPRTAELFQIWAVSAKASLVRFAFGPFFPESR